MTLDEARAEVEQLFTPYPELGDNRKCATGERYLTLCSRGIKPVGESTEGFTEEGIAITEWLSAFKEYSKDKRGTLYWRWYPTLEQLDDSTWNVYSRLLISDLPAVQPQRIGE